MDKMEIIDAIQREMQEFDKGSPERIQHFTKVHSFAAQIGRREQLDEETQFTLEVTTLLHDIGIGPSERKYGHCTGKMQEEEGPPFARAILEKFPISKEVVERVCYLIAHHHTYDMEDGLDYQILLEADFLVNLYENSINEEGVRSAYQKIFVTNAGRHLCAVMFDCVE